MLSSLRTSRILPLIAATGLLAAGATTQLATAQDMSDVEQSAIAHVESMTDAYRANDVDGYLGHYAKELTWWGPGGRGSWDAYHSSWTDYVANNGGVASAEISNAVAQVSPSGDAAVVSYLLTADYRSSDGSVSRSNLQMSTSMMMRDGGWKIVHLHFQSRPDEE